MKFIISLLQSVVEVYKLATDRLARFVSSKVLPKCTPAEVKRAIDFFVPFAMFLTLRFAPLFTVNCVILIGTLLLVTATVYSMVTNALNLFIPFNNSSKV